MIHSLCIKSNNQKTLDYLLEAFENINLDNISLSQNKFKIYHNIIIHYRGNMPNMFLHYVADILSNCIIDCYERNLLKTSLNYNYFYFSDHDKCHILENCIDILQQEEYESRRQIIFLTLLKYIKENHTLILDGFLHFRLKEYSGILEDICDISVDHFLIEREYNEFVNLLKLYIKSKPSHSNKVHMVYLNQDSYLFDQHYNLIPRDETLLNAKYLSDITFSSNDFALNTLLNLLPNKIVIHLISKKDEFTNTLELIFEGHVSYCEDCEFCRTYQKAISMYHV